MLSSFPTNGIQATDFITSGTSFQNVEKARIEMRRFRFILAFPIIRNSATISSENIRCPLCKKTCGADIMLGDPAKNTPEAACKLPCGCVLGFLCIRQYLSPFEEGHTACPICKSQFSELVEETTDFPWIPFAEESGAVYPDPNEEDVRTVIKQLENDTGLQFVSEDGSLEAVIRKAYIREEHRGDTIAEDSIALDRQGSSADIGSAGTLSSRTDAKSTGIIVRGGDGKRKHSSLRRWGLARAAVEAVNQIAKRSG